MSEYKNRVRELRSQHNVNQKELAEAIGITQQQVSSIEKGTGYPSMTVAKKIATYFGESIDEIFFTQKDNLKL